MPQHAKRLKVRRKDLRRPDEFETLTGQAVDWADEHRNLVIAAVTTLVVIGLAMLVVGRWRANRNEAASAAFRAAQASFEGGRFAQAAEAFASLASTYPGAPFGRLAGLYRAHALARQGDPGAAAAAYADYLATSPDADYLRQEALAGLARAKEANGDTTAALEAFTQAAALPGPYRSDALLGEARLLEASGQSEKARELYAQLLKDTSDAELQALLRAKLPPGSQPPEAAAAATGTEAAAPEDSEDEETR
jgi:predicted negative regulator of RcsB-dependent stress response